LISTTTRGEDPVPEPLGLFLSRTPATPKPDYVLSRRAKIRKVALDSMHVVVTTLPERSAVAEGHQSLVWLLAPISWVAQVAPRAPVLEMMKRHSSPSPTGCALTVVPRVVTPFSYRPLVGAVVTLQPGRVGHLRDGSFTCFRATDFHPAAATLRDSGPPCLAVASVAQQGVLGPCDHDQFRSAVRTLLGRKGHKGHGAKRRRLDFDGLGVAGSLRLSGHDTARSRSSVPEKSRRQRPRTANVDR
jgi:hypothetical protein